MRRRLTSIALTLFACTAASACSWNEPGRHPTTVPAALLAQSHYGVDEATAARIDALHFDRIVAITKHDRLHDMSHGPGEVCTGAVDMHQWDERHREYAMAYVLPDGRTLIVAFTCHNLAWLTEQAPGGGSGPGDGGDGFDLQALLDADPPGAGQTGAVPVADPVTTNLLSTAALAAAGWTGGVWWPGTPGFGGGDFTIIYRDRTVVIDPPCCCDEPPVITPPPVSVVPEPSTWALFACSMAVVAQRARRRGVPA